MTQLSDRVLNMATSATLAMAAKTRELKAEGKDIIGLSLGEPDFNNLNYKHSQIVVSTGAKQSLANIAAVMLNKGDEVILPCPYWVSYSDIVKLNEGVPVEVKTSIDNDFKLTPQQLEVAITPKTKMIWYSSPCNPSGSVYSKAELRALADEKWIYWSSRSYRKSL